MAQATFKSGTYRTADYTPSSAVSAGDVIVANDVVRIAHRDIAANELGALATGGGSYEVAKASGEMTAGARVYWDAADEEVNTDDGNPHFGFVDENAASGAATVIVKHDPDGLAPAAG